MNYRLLIVFIIVLAVSCKAKKEPIQKGVSWDLAEYRKSVINSIQYELDIRVPSSLEDQIQGYEVLTFNLINNERDILLDFKEKPDHLKAIVINGSSQDIIFQNEHVVLPKNKLNQGFNKVEVNFIVGESSLNRNEDYLYTLFVPDRARTAFPSFDQPNLKAKYKLNLEVPDDWNAISNAPIELMKILEGRKSIAFSTSDLMSTYLFSFVAGKFKSVSTEIGGRSMTMLHRETDEGKIKRNIDAIFELHHASIQWMETYTGIVYPFQKFDFALIPGFQYGGMEHVGAIQYRANSLFLDEDPSDTQLLSRASLIAHETAHMWFGDLVTMDWFNDVWTKEVFANFMAAKMVNPSFPKINHQLNFLMRHYPSAYGVDRAEGANPIRQELDNLNEAGQMYGAIIYNKAPIMMRQLEMILGESSFRKGMQTYLTSYANKNATWPDLINILNDLTPLDLITWSDVWVNSPGRPSFRLMRKENTSETDFVFEQFDPKGSKVWPQLMSFRLYEKSGTVKEYQVASREEPFEIEMDKDWQSIGALYNTDGIGYGLYPVSFNLFKEKWALFNEVEKGAMLINGYEQLLEEEQDQMSPEQYLEMLKWLMVRETNQLLINRILSQARAVYWSMLTKNQRESMAPDLERTLVHCMNDVHDDPAIKRSYFNALRSVAITTNNLARLYRIWTKEEQIQGVRLSENNYIALASELAIKLPERSAEIIAKQKESITNPDSRRRFDFISPSLSNDQLVRDSFFESLKDEKNRETESWVLSALGNLHHPLRQASSEQYILPSLELLEEIQKTGDIFFPKRWLDQTLTNHNSDEALKITEQFLADRPEYNMQLTMKILQSVDFAKRSNAIQKIWAKK